MKSFLRAILLSFLLASCGVAINSQKSNAKKFVVEGKQGQIVYQVFESDHSSSVIYFCIFKRNAGSTVWESVTPHGIKTSYIAWPDSYLPSFGGENHCDARSEATVKAALLSASATGTTFTFQEGSREAKCLNLAINNFFSAMSEHVTCKP